MQMRCISIEPLKKEWVQDVNKKCGIEIKFLDGTDRENWERIQKCELLICRDRDLSVKFLDEFVTLKYIYIVSAGVEKLPFEYLKKRNILVMNSGGASDAAMSDYVIGAMLLFSSNFKECIENKMKKHWKKFLYSNSLRDKKILIVGAGRIGCAIAQKAKAMGMLVYGIKRSRTEIPYFDKIFSLQNMKTILPLADYIVCTIPLTEETMYLFDMDKFELMNSNAIFINVSRGKIIKENDLINALKENKIRAAVLDVFETEPLPQESKLWDLDNVIITPHSSGRIENFLEYSMDIFSRNMNCLLQQKNIPNLIDLDRGY